MKALGGENYAYAICLAVATLLTVIAYPAIRVIINKIASYFLTRSASEQAKKLRSGAPAEPVKARQTDLIGLMSREDREKHREAQALLSTGQVREAAALFESIRFQRRAVDILEQAGLIDEACAVLARLNVPHRIAAIYERNGMLPKAAHFYNVAGLYLSAGRVFLKLAKNDFHLLASAAEAFQKAGKPEEMLEAYAGLLLTDKIVQACVAGGHYKFLASYMHLPACASEVFAVIPTEKIVTLCAAVDENPSGMRLYASWLSHPAADAALPNILQRAGGSDELARYFSEGLSPELRHGIHASLARLALPPQTHVRLDKALVDPPAQTLRKSA